MSRSNTAVLVVAAVGLLLARTSTGCADGVVLGHAPADEGSNDTSDAGSANAEAGAGDSGPAALPTCSADGWCYTTLPAAPPSSPGDVLPDPNGVRFALTSVWSAPDRHAWAVSSAGHVLHWDGTAWSIAFVASAGLHGVWGASATDVWIAGDAGLLLHGTGSSGALTFQHVALGTSQRIKRVWGTSPSDVWVLADRVYHLTADSAASATPFVPVDVPSSFGDDVAYVRISAVWGTASDTWFGGSEVSHCAPPSCANVDRLFAARRRVDAGGTVSWDTVPMPIADATAVVAGSTTTNGVQIVALKTRLFDTAFAAWIADDASKLDPARGPITVAGAHAWNFELAERYGQPEGLWGRAPNDVWLVGQYGVVRRFDGKGWQVSRVARTSLAPLVSHLRSIDAIVDASGEREMWIVGDDVALHRRTKP